MNIGESYYGTRINSKKLVYKILIEYISSS